jgi:hypothetical protein
MNYIGLFSAILLISINSFGNDGSYSISGYGGSVIPIINPSVSMIQENIYITINLENTYSYKTNFDCNFVFKNMTEQKQSVLIGFPYLSNYSVNIKGKYNKLDYSSIQDFKFFVNSKDIEYKNYINELNPDNHKLPIYDGVFATTVVFDPHESKKIKNTFTIFNSLMPSITANPLGYTSNNKINYVLKTGLTWKDPIKKSDIYIIFKSIPENFFDVEAKPLQFEESHNPYTLHYDYTDFNPSEDISIVLSFKYIDEDTAEKQIMDYYKKGDIENVMHLFRKWHETVWKKLFTLDKLSDKKNIKDCIRKASYFMAGKLFSLKQDYALELYYLAFRYTYSIYWTSAFFYIDFPPYFPYYNKNDSSEIPFNKWEYEGENNAPCYYIAYNIACIYSLKNKLEIADSWLKIAVEMNSKLKNNISSDDDLANYRLYYKY